MSTPREYRHDPRQISEETAARRHSQLESPAERVAFEELHRLTFLLPYISRLLKVKCCNLLNRNSKKVDSHIHGLLSVMMIKNMKHVIISSFIAEETGFSFDKFEVAVQKTHFQHDV